MSHLAVVVWDWYVRWFTFYHERTSRINLTLPSQPCKALRHWDVVVYSEVADSVHVSHQKRRLTCQWTVVSQLIFWFISKHRVELAQVGSCFSNNSVELGEFDWIFGQIGVELNVILRRWKLENTEMTRLTPSKRPQNADFAHKSSGFELSWACSRVDCSRVDFSRVD